MSPTFLSALFYVGFEGDPSDIKKVTVKSQGIPIVKVRVGDKKSEDQITFYGPENFPGSNMWSFVKFDEHNIPYRTANELDAKYKQSMFSFDSKNLDIKNYTIEIKHRSLKSGTRVKTTSTIEGNKPLPYKILGTLPPSATFRKTTFIVNDGISTLQNKEMVNSTAVNIKEEKPMETGNKKIIETLNILFPILPEKPAYYEGEIVEFYMGQTRTPQTNLSIDDVHSLTWEKLENAHDYIQKIFPIRTASQAIKPAPISTEKDEQQFRDSLYLRRQILKSLFVMLDFYGLEYDIMSDSIIKAPHFKQRALVWLNADNHNHARLSRILSSLQLYDFQEYSLKLHLTLKQIYKENPTAISPKTIKIWQEFFPI